MENEKDYDLILSTSKLVLEDYKKYSNKKDYKDCSNEQFKIKMEEKYSDFKNENNIIFEKCITGRMDINMLTYMINQAKEIQKNKISNYDASVKVGEKLVDKFIKPLLDKDKDKDKDN